MTKERGSSTVPQISAKSGAKGSFWDFLSLVSGHVVLIPLALVSSALTARILGAEGYGYIALFGIVTGIINLLTSNWTLAAVLRFGREEYDKTSRLNHTFWARNLILLPGIIFGFAIIYLLRARITDYVGIPQWTVWLILGTALVQIGRGYLYYILQAIHRMKGYVGVQVLNSLLGTIGIGLIFFGFFEKTYLSVIIMGLFTGAIATVSMLFMMVPSKILLPVETDRDTMREVFYFSYPVIAGNIAAYMVQWVDTLVIKHYFGVAEVGTYQIAYEAFTLLSGLIGLVNVLMTPMLISFVAAKRNDLVIRYSTRLVPQALLLWATVVGLGMIIAPFAFELIYGEEFRISSTYFQFLIFGLTLNGLSNFYSGIMTAHKLIKLAIVASIARALVNLVGDLLLVPSLGALGATLANTVGIGVAGLLYLIICQRELKKGLSWQLILILPALLSLGACRLIQNQGLSSVVAVVVTLASSYYLAKKLNLFKSEDLTFLDHIQMPVQVRKVVVQVYALLARDEGTPSGV